MTADTPHVTPNGNALPAGTRLGEFELRSVVGVGGFGIVYLAFDHGLEREVAIKEYMPTSLAARTATLHVSSTSPGNAETFALGLKSFVNEARLLARFDHGSLIKVHRFWEERGTAYMVMPLYRGRTLREVRTAMQGAPDEAWMRSLLEPLLGALEVLHREDVFHRDIAPDNILIGDDGVPMLLDFGAARHVISDRSQMLTAILKPSYAPIEQYGESPSLRQGAWTDLYALGATLHFLITQSPPAPATTRMVHEDAPPLAATAYPNLSEGFLRVIDWMLAPRPADRPKSVAELREVLAGRKAVPTRVEPPANAAWQRTAPVPAGSSPPSSTWLPATAAQDETMDLDLTMPQPMSLSVSALMSSTPGPRPNTPPPPPPPKPPPVPISAAARKPDAAAPMLAAGLPVEKPMASSASSVRWVAGGAAALLLAAGGFWALQRDGQPAAPAAAASAPTEPVSVTQSPAPPAGNSSPSSAVAAASSVEALPALTAAGPGPASTAGAGLAVASPVVAGTASSPAEAAAPKPPASVPMAAAKATPVAAQAAQAERDRAAAANRPPANTRATLVLPTRETPPPMLPRLPTNEPTAPAPAPAQRPATNYGGEAPPGRGNATRAVDTPAVIEAAPQTASSGNPREQCGNRLLLALHLCLVRQCAKPQYTNHEECVRVRQIEERAARTPG
ncbi:MAG: serine/threonine protein kinase [Ideonella sp.]|nr:serine/threonine protein kinase [Ideonella sp.]